MIVRTYDEKYVREVITHPKIWPYLSDDTSNLATWVPCMDKSVYWLVPYDGEKALGVFMVHPHSNVCFEVHTAILPEAYGAQAKLAARNLIEWVFKNTGCCKLITAVPASNLLAKRFALRAGMREEGVNRESFLREGKMIDQTMLGITKGEALCQPQQ